MVAVEVGRPPGLRVSLSRRRLLLARRPPAAPLVAVLIQLVQLAVVQLVEAPQVPVPVQLVGAQRVRVPLLVDLWGLGSPQERRSWVPVWVRPGAWPISPLATRGRPRWRRPAPQDRPALRAAGATQAQDVLVVVHRVAVEVVSQRERERCIGDECCCSGAGEDGGTYLRRVA